MFQWTGDAIIVGWRMSKKSQARSTTELWAGKLVDNYKFYLWDQNVKFQGQGHQLIQIWSNVCIF